MFLKFVAKNCKSALYLAVEGVIFFGKFVPFGIYSFDIIFYVIVNNIWGHVLKIS